MEAVDHGWKKPGGGGPSKGVAHEFVEADKATHAYAGGGAVKEGSHDVEYAKGGGQLGRTKDFMKTPDQFRDDGTSRETGGDKADQDYGKDGPAKGKANPAGADKSLKAIKPKG
jgi:hypothetical protein